MTALLQIVDPRPAPAPRGGVGLSPLVARLRPVTLLRGLAGLLAEAVAVGKAAAAEAASPEERRLVRIARAGGPEGRAAFDDLVRMHQAWLIRVLYFLLGSASDAQDVAQEAFARAFVGLDGLTDDRRGMRPWLRTIATRLAFNFRRDRATRRRHEDGAGSQRSPQVAARGEAMAEEQAVLRALDDVSYLYREALVFYYLEDRSVREISEILGTSISATKMRLSRARAEFKQVYEGMTE